jgi:MoaA/NifB/PqqE/SkfB family radical SAM enzyme
MTPFAERKILGHVETLQQYLAGGHYAPIQVEIDLTNLCTSACPWCAGYLNREWSKATLFAAGETAEARWEASIRGVSRLLGELAGMGVKSVTWTGGGDPTCHKHWLLLVEQAAYLGLENGLITNGVIDVAEAVPWCQWIRFSVDAATQATYATQHGRAQHFPRVLAHVAAAAARKQADGAACTIGVAMLTSEATHAEIVPFARLWAGVPLDYIQYRPLLDTHGKAWFSDRQDTLALLREAAAEDPRVVWSEPKYNALVRGEHGRTQLCHGIYFETAISADGKVYVCCHLKGNGDYAIGDLTHESFAAIWRRHLANRRFATTKDCPSFCRHFGTNTFLEIEVMPERQHANFI